LVTFRNDENAAEQLQSARLLENLAAGAESTLTRIQHPLRLRRTREATATTNASKQTRRHSTDHPADNMTGYSGMINATEPHVNEKAVSFIQSLCAFDVDQSMKSNDALEYADCQMFNSIQYEHNCFHCIFPPVKAGDRNQQIKGHNFVLPRCQHFVLQFYLFIALSM
jgi:hypothetical protein